MRCSHCSHINPDENRFCNYCGTRLLAPARLGPQLTHCPICGFQNPPQREVCLYCRNPLPSTPVSTLICAVCGRGSEGTNIFCTSCGSRLVIGLDEWPFGASR